jgi:triosephosphate isomerase
MRKKIVAGNWKMNTSFARGIELGVEINKLLRKQAKNEVTVILAPPFTHIAELVKVTDYPGIFIAAQNCSSEPKGAFTGEVSAKMIKSTGAEYVIIGHSERRSIFNETNHQLLDKLKLALENELTPIFCIGEKLEERQAGNYFDVIQHQLDEAAFQLSPEDFSKIVIAYEPVWAIGTGLNASPEQAQEVHSFIRSAIAKKFNEEQSLNTSILYGGSCKASNARALFVQPDVDGGLIGGASLDAAEFVAIVNSFQ